MMGKKTTNRIGFTGVLALVDTPSDKSPLGARGHLVLMKREAALKALPFLVGMGVNYREDFAGHNERHKVGVITSAELVGNELRVSGLLWFDDFPEVINSIKAQAEDSLGMSYELADAHVDDMRQVVWIMSRVNFTGAAIILRDKTAYRASRFSLEVRDDAKSES
jgi:hypothetical protein